MVYKLYGIQIIWYGIQIMADKFMADKFMVDKFYNSCL